MALPCSKLEGIVAATFTPLHENGTINTSVIGTYVDYLVKVQRVKSIFVNGTTGEGLSLSVEERKQLAAEWVNQGKDKLDNVIIHVGCLCLKESQELAAHAADIKADGIAVIAPFFLKPQNKETLVKFLEEIASAAPGLPFYYYHIPELTGVNILAEDILDQAQSIQTFRGLKFSGSDLVDFGRCVHKYESKLALLYGKDEQLLCALVLGGCGAVGSTYNYLGWWNNQMLDAFKRKDYVSARQHQFSVQEFISYACKLGFGVAENKHIMTLYSGIPLGPPRLPLMQCTNEIADKLKQKLTELQLCPPKQ